MPAAAPFHVGKTWLLGHGRKRKTVYPLAVSRKSCNFAAIITTNGNDRRKKAFKEF